MFSDLKKINKAIPEFEENRTRNIFVTTFAKHTGMCYINNLF